MHTCNRVHNPSANLHAPLATKTVDFEGHDGHHDCENTQYICNMYVPMPLDPYIHSNNLNPSSIQPCIAMQDNLFQTCRCPEKRRFQSPSRLRTYVYVPSVPIHPYILSNNRKSNSNQHTIFFFFFTLIIKNLCPEKRRFQWSSRLRTHVCVPCVPTNTHTSIRKIENPTPTNRTTYSKPASPRKRRFQRSSRLRDTKSKLA